MRRFLIYCLILSVFYSVQHFIECNTRLGGWESGRVKQRSEMCKLKSSPSRLRIMLSQILLFESYENLIFTVATIDICARTQSMSCSLSRSRRHWKLNKKHTRSSCCCRRIKRSAIKGSRRVYFSVGVDLTCQHKQSDGRLWRIQQMQNFQIKLELGSRKYCEIEI